MTEEERRTAVQRLVQATARGSLANRNARRELLPEDGAGGEEQAGGNTRRRMRSPEQVVQEEQSALLLAGGDRPRNMLAGTSTRRRMLSPAFGGSTHELGAQAATGEDNGAGLASAGGGLPMAQGGEDLIMPALTTIPGAWTLTADQKRKYRDIRSRALAGETIDKRDVDFAVHLLHISQVAQGSAERGLLAAASQQVVLTPSASQESRGLITPSNIPIPDTPVTGSGGRVSLNWSDHDMACTTADYRRWAEENLASNAGGTMSSSAASVPPLPALREEPVGGRTPTTPPSITNAAQGSVRAPQSGSPEATSPPSSAAASTIPASPMQAEPFGSTPAASTSRGEWTTPPSGDPAWMPPPPPRSPAGYDQIPSALSPSSTTESRSPLTAERSQSAAPMLEQPSWLSGPAGFPVSPPPNAEALLRSASGMSSMSAAAPPAGSASGSANGVAMMGPVATEGVGSASSVSADTPAMVFSNSLRTLDFSGNLIQVLEARASVRTSATSTEITTGNLAPGMLPLRSQTMTGPINVILQARTETAIGRADGPDQTMRAPMRWIYLRPPGLELMHGTQTELRAPIYLNMLREAEWIEIYLHGHPDDAIEAMDAHSNFLFSLEEATEQGLRAIRCMDRARDQDVHLQSQQDALQGQNNWLTTEGPAGSSCQQMLARLGELRDEVCRRKRKFGKTLRHMTRMRFRLQRAVPLGFVATPGMGGQTQLPLHLGYRVFIVKSLAATLGVHPSGHEPNVESWAWREGVPRIPALFPEDNSSGEESGGDTPRERRMILRHSN